VSLSVSSWFRPPLLQLDQHHSHPSHPLCIPPRAQHAYVLFVTDMNRQDLFERLLDEGGGDETASTINISDLSSLHPDDDNSFANGVTALHVGLATYPLEMDRG